jgi:hypothetical protein
MRVFFAHYTSGKAAEGAAAQVLKIDMRREALAAAKLVCEEEAIDAV